MDIETIELLEKRLKSRLSALSKAAKEMEAKLPKDPEDIDMKNPEQAFLYGQLLGFQEGVLQLRGLMMEMGALKLEK